MLNVAVISPFSPGATWSFCDCAVVQPHDACTDLKCTGVVPTFSYLKCATACLSPIAGCRSAVVCSHFNSARATPQRKIDNVTAKISRLIFKFIVLQNRFPHFLSNRHRNRSYGRGLKTGVQPKSPL